MIDGSRRGGVRVRENSGESNWRKWLRYALVGTVVWGAGVFAVKFKERQSDQFEGLVTEHVSQRVVRNVLGQNLRQVEEFYGAADGREKVSMREELAFWEFGSFGMQLQFYRRKVTRIIFQADDAPTRKLIYDRVIEEFSREGGWRLADKYPSDQYLSVVIDREQRIRVWELDRSVRIYGYLLD